MNNWKTVKLGDVIGKEGVFVDGDWVESKDQNPNGEIRLIQLADIGESEFRDRSDRYLTYKKAVELNCTFLEKGDILVARMPYPLGRACIFPLSGKNKYVTVVDVAIIRIDKKKVDNKFLCYIINAPQSRNKISELQSGSTRKRISRKNLGTILFPLPPLPEQKKIVAKIEELFSGLDSGFASLKNAKEQIRLYRQSVLASAFSGRLINNEQLIMNNEKLIINNSSLPPGWEWVKVSDIGEVVTGTTPSKKNSDYYGNDYPLFKPTDLNAGINTFKASDNISKLGASKARLLPEKSVMVTCIGATIGKTGMNKSIGATNQQINSIVLSNIYIPEFVYYFFISDFFQKQIKENASSTTLPILNKSKFELLPFIEVPHNQQQQIVSEIEKRFSEADNLEKAIDDSLAKSELLRQSILNRAFSGKLV